MVTPTSKSSIEGLKFGYLTVLSQNFSGFKKRKAWNCQCDCGNNKVVTEHHLKSGSTKSCGCTHKNSKNAPSKLEPLALENFKFGYFTVVKYIGRNELLEKKSGQKRYDHDYYCICKCGTEKILKRSTILSKIIKSCGCVRSEIRKKFLTEKIGLKFGRLSIISIDKKNMLNCLCECGNEIKTKFSAIKSGRKSSCGCLLKQSQIANAKKATLSNFLPDSDWVYNHHYSIYKHGASKRHLNFELTHEQFKNLIMQNCHYCGKSPSKKLPKAVQKTRKIILVNGIDRIDSFQGYSEPNCVPCCSICNLAKRQMPYNEFIKWLDQLVLFRGKK